MLPAADAARRAWWRWRRPLVLGVLGILVDDRRRVLLVRNSYRPGWHLPGGGLNRRERWSDALRREVGEEVGLKITDPGRLLGIYFGLDAGASHHVAVYVVEGWTGDPAIDGFEIIDAGFFALEALPRDLSAGVRRRLDEWRGLRTVSEFW